MAGHGVVEQRDLRIERRQFVERHLQVGLDLLERDDGLVVALDGEAELGLDLLQTGLGRDLLVGELALACVEGAEFRTSLRGLVLELLQLPLQLLEPGRVRLGVGCRYQQRR